MFFDRHCRPQAGVVRALATVAIAGLPGLGVANSVSLTYETAVPPGGHGELDTPTLWVSPSGSSALLLVTDKTWDYVEIHDPISNTYLGRLGGSGSQPGRLSRPNAAIVDYGVPTVAGPRDILFVVERDNHRVSMFALPNGNYMGSIGDAVLEEPMGIALHRDGGQPQIWVTDIGPRPQRVVVFDVTSTPTGLVGVLDRSFAAPSGAVLESIAIDGENGNVILCDEGSFDMMLYTMNGTFVRRFGTNLFTDDPEGIAIYDTGNGAGYVIVTDQVASPVQWEVFDRQTLTFVREFTGATEGTDGIALERRALPNFPEGSFFAVHEDRTVHAYDWTAIASAAGLCVGTPCDPTDAADPESEIDARARIHTFPTPFRGTGTMAFRLDAAARVAIDVYDLRGGRVARLEDGLRGPGQHAVTWDGRDARGARLPSGVYLVRTVLGNTAATHKVTIVR